MKILLLSQYFPPEFGACAARNSEHAAQWAARGHEVEVCTAFPNYPAGIIAGPYRGRFYQRESKDGYSVLRSWIFATPNRATWRRALASITFMCSAFLSALFAARRPDVVIASSGPFFVGPLGYALSVLKRAAFVMEVRDILPQQAVDVGMIKNPLLVRALEAIEKFLYRRARVVVTVAEASRESLIKRGLPESKCFTIENGILPDLFAPGSRDNEVRAQYGWGADFVAMYIGVHGVSQGLDTLLEAAHLLRDKEGIRFVLVGDGAEKPSLVKFAQDHHLGNVEFLPIQPRERVPLFYAAANVCFVPLRRGDYFRINIPSKVFEILAVERPIIIGAEGQARAIVDESGGGIAVTPESAHAYADAVLRLQADPAFAESLGRSGRAYVLENFSREKKAARYIEILERTLVAR